MGKDWSPPRLLRLEWEVLPPVCHHVTQREPQASLTAKIKENKNNATFNRNFTSQDKTETRIPFAPCQLGTILCNEKKKLNK